MKTQIDLERKIEELEKQVSDLEKTNSQVHEYWQRAEAQVRALKVLCLADLNFFMSKEELVTEVLETIYVMKR